MDFFKRLLEITKLAPTSSEVHVPTAGSEKPEDKDKKPPKPSELTATELAPSVNNLEAEMIKIAYDEADAGPSDPAFPDPATADDADPRMNVFPFESMPNDQMLAADALGYTWADQTTSGFGNRLHGYPSQGALGSAEKDHDSENIGVLRSAMNAFMEAFNKFLGEEEVEKDVLTAEGRKHIAEDNFALPGRRYPIHDLAHARNALARSSGKPEEGKVRVAVYSKYPALKPTAKIAKKVDLAVPIIKKDQLKQVAYCVVLEPDMMDSQEDVMSADDIEETAHAYMVRSRVIGSGHEKPIDAIPVESYIAPQDLTFEGGPYGDQVVKKGSWVLGIKVNDPDEWEKVMSQDYTGVSVAGYGERL